MTNNDDNSNNIKRITEWEVLTPTGWQDFDGVKKTTKSSSLTISFMDPKNIEQTITCSKGHQLFIKRYDEQMYMFAEMIDAETDAILYGDNKTFCAITGIKENIGEVELYDLVNVRNGYEYITNGVVSHNCAHVEGIDELWLGLQPTLSCVAGDTLILTDNGFVRIEDFHKNKNIGDYFDLEIPVYGKHGMELTSKGYVSPESETMIVRTKHGHKVEVTPKHPLYSLQDDGFGKMVQTQNLKLGDYLRIEVGQNCFGKTNLHPDMAYMLGGYIAEGWIPKRSSRDPNDKRFYMIEVENYDDGFRDVFLKSDALKKNFKVVPSRWSRLRCSSKEIVDQFISLGIDPYKHAHSKITPKSILEGDRESIINYLSGLFDGDGCVCESISLSSTSEKLILETSLLLHNLGFICNIHFVPSNPKKLGRSITGNGKGIQSLRDSWSLTLTRSQFTKFYSEIGFRITKKQEKLKKLIEKYPTIDDRKLYTIPMSEINSVIRSLYSKVGKPKVWFRENGLRLDKCLDKKGKDRFVNKVWLKKFKTILVEKAGLVLTDVEEQFFNENIGSFYWDEIVSIQKSHNKTYDFTVPKTHSFLQNGILGSNTGGSAILISSPAGVGNLFHRIWVDAKTDPNKHKEGKNGFFPIELPWTVHPERDQNWFNAQRAEIITATGERGVGMELLCLSEDSMISTENNGTKKIKNIKVGDIVLTHKGQYKSVTKLYKHKLKENENLYEVTVPGTKHKMLITDNHPILNYSFTVPKGKNKIAYLKEALKNNEVSLRFNSIGELDYYKNISVTNGRKVAFGCLYPDDIDNIDLIKLERHSIGELEWQAIPNTDYNSELAPYVYNIEVEDDHSYVANGFIVHNCNFASSGDTFIKGEALDDLMNATKPPVHIQAHGRDEAWIWEAPNPNNKYIISADVSRGDSDDFSTFVIIDTNENEVVADFKGKLPPDKFADLLVSYGETYNNALICQELNSIGVACAIKLKSSKYKNLFYEKFQKNMYMSYITQEVEDEFPGFTMAQNTRTEILAKLEATIRNKKIKLYSKRLFEELQTFIWKNNKPQAQKGYNDDLSIALAIGCSLYEPDGTSTSNNADDAWALLKGMSRESKTINPYTGDQKTHNKQNIATSTADGMFKLKSKGPTQGMQPGRITGANSGLHHYTDAQWALVKWMYEE